MSSVSIIIPTYNRAAVLRRAIESVLAQTYQAFELIVVDDGSTDATHAIIAEYGDRISYRFQANRGVSRARNWGIRVSTGGLIAFLDSDDAWLPHKLERQVAVMAQHPDLPLCHTEEIWIRRGVRVNPKQKHQKRGGDIFPDCLPLCVISPSSAMLRRSIFDDVGYFDEMLPVCEDYDLWLRITQTYPVAFIEEPLIVKYGGDADQLSQQYWGIDRFRIQALEKLLQADKLTPAQREQTLQELRRKCRIVANGCLKRQKLADWEQYSQIPAKYE